MLTNVPRRDFAGLIIGLTVAGMITATGNIAGASLNTARTFGPYMMDFLLGGPNLWAFFPIYIIGPVIGAVVAAVFYDRDYRRMTVVQSSFFEWFFIISQKHRECLIPPSWHQKV